jgi:predicted Fe-S protein YdhL (DUF1289 family)
LAKPAEKTEVPSPCVGVCRRDGGGYCNGCLRSVPEITRWNQMPSVQKRQCLEQLALRRRKKERGKSKA